MAVVSLIVVVLFEQSETAHCFFSFEEDVVEEEVTIIIITTGRTVDADASLLAQTNPQEKRRRKVMKGRNDLEVVADFVEEAVEVATEDVPTEGNRGIARAFVWEFFKYFILS